MTQGLDRLGDDVRAQQDAALSLRPLPPLALDTRANAHPRSMRSLVAAASLGAVVSAAVTLFVAPLISAPATTTTAANANANNAPPVPAPTTAHFDLDNGHTPLATWIVPHEGVTRLIGASDGTEVRLRSGARARVLPLEARNVIALEIERGNVVLMRASNATASARPWIVEAGPYQVDVDAGRATLEVIWDPRAQDIAVSVLDGRATLRGPGGDKTIDASAPFERRQLRPPTTATALKPRAPAAATIAPEIASAPPVVVEEPLVDERLTWQQLARTDCHSEAVTLARNTLDAIITSGSSNDLMLLATSARFTASHDMAKQSYLAVRERFPSTTNAANAAFYLARMTADVARDDRGAVVLLRAYLDEAPAGSFREEATGRWIEALVRLGLADEAHKLGREYLAAWPKGAYANSFRASSAGDDGGGREIWRGGGADPALSRVAEVIE